MTRGAVRNTTNEDHPLVFTIDEFIKAHNISYGKF